MSNSVTSTIGGAREHVTIFTILINDNAALVRRVHSESMLPISDANVVASLMWTSESAADGPVGPMLLAANVFCSMVVILNDSRAMSEHKESMAKMAS